jgi:regulator of replication initiation timing
VNTEFAALKTSFSEKTIALDTLTKKHEKLVEDFDILSVINILHLLYMLHESFLTKLLKNEKKNLQVEYSLLMDERDALFDQTAELEDKLGNKEREFNELIQRMTDTIKDYETKLAQKDEQMILLGNKLADETARRNEMAQIPKEVENTNNTSEDLEKKWQSRFNIFTHFSSGKELHAYFIY